jgi:hypothetical protein
MLVFPEGSLYVLAKDVKTEYFYSGLDKRDLFFVENRRKSGGKSHSVVLKYYHDWLVVWNICYFSIYWEE